MSLQTAESRVSDLRKRDAVGEAWQWIVDLKQQAKSDPKGAEAQLNAIFKLGTVPTDLDGPTDGILVMTTTTPVLDAVARLVTARWMPWRGKRFDAVASTGDNRMTASSRLPAKLLWPLYTMKDAADGKLAFDFKTYADAGKADPDVRVMVIDYADVDDNPG